MPKPSTQSLVSTSFALLPFCMFLSMLLPLVQPAAGQMGSSTASSTATTTAPGDKEDKEGKEDKEDNKLSILNAEFRSVYKKNKERYSEATVPLIMCTGDHMVLIDNNFRDQVFFLPDKYTRLKVVDHIPLVLFVLLDPQCGKAFDAETKQELDKIKKLVTDVRPGLAGLGLDAPTLARQYQLLDRSVGFIEQVLRQERVSQVELVKFCRDLKPMIMKNVDQAVAAQLAIMDRKMLEWQKKLGPERFKKLTVVIVSGHMPRERNTSFQYFAKALHVKREGLKIVYSEGPDEEKSARDLVGTHVLDASIGEAFFKEQLRMHRDLLSDGATRYLSTHRPLSKKHGDD